MTHFPVVVVLPEGTDVTNERAVSGAIETALAPYWEEADVEPYGRACDCGELAQMLLARQSADAAVGATLEDFRESFVPIRKATTKGIPSRGASDAQLAAVSDIVERRWKEHAAPWFDAYNAAKAATPATPQSDCPSCHGTGTYESVYNPQSKWDWYRVGARWDGWLRDLPPLAAPADQKAAIDFHYSDAVETLARNMCQLRDARDEPPWAVVLPVEGWVEKGTMGWWAVSVGEKPDEDWQASWDAIRKEHGDLFAVLVDCHI